MEEDGRDLDRDLFYCRAFLEGLPRESKLFLGLGYELLQVLFARSDLEERRSRGGLSEEQVTKLEAVDALLRDKEEGMMEVLLEDVPYMYASSGQERPPEHWWWHLDLDAYADRVYGEDG